MRTFHKLHQLVKLFAGVIAASVNFDTGHQFRLIENLEILVLKQVVEFHKAHSKAGIRFVRTIVFHSVSPCDAFHSIQFYILESLEDMFYQSFEDIENVLLFNERHLAVDLGKLGLAVGAQVLIAEAAHNLEIAVHAGNHQQLFQRLR